MKLSSILRKTLTAGAALAALASTTALTAPSAMAQDAAKPNILFVMTDDVAWMAPGIYHQGMMVGETPNIDRIGREGVKFIDAYAEQSCTAGRNAFMTGMNPLRTGLIVPQLPGSPSWLTARHAVGRQGPARSRLQYVPGRQEPFGRQCRGAADRARIPGVLGLPLSSRRDAAGQLHGRLQSEDEPAEDVRGPAVQGDVDPRRPRRSERRRPGDDDLSDPAAPAALVQVLRRHAGEPDLQG